MKTTLFILTKVDKSYDGDLYVDSSIHTTEQDAVDAMRRDFKMEMNDIESDDEDELIQNGNTYSWEWEDRELLYTIKSQDVLLK